MAVVSDRPVTRPPYEAYATIMGVFVGGIAVAGGLARLLGRDPREHTFLDLLNPVGRELQERPDDLT